MVVVMWVWAWEFADLLLELAPLALGLLATRLGLRHSGGWSTPGVRGNVRRAPCALGGHTYSEIWRNFIKTDGTHWALIAKDAPSDGRRLAGVEEHLNLTLA